jgi:hypothetical protein
MRRALLIVSACLAVAMAATAAGCGGSGGGKRLTKDEFVAKADGICAAANKKVPTPPTGFKNFDPTAGKGTDADYKRYGDYVQKVVKIFRGEVGDLRGLKPPTNLQDTFDKAIATLDEAVNELNDAGTAAKDGNRAVVKAKLAESDKHGKDANKFAKQLGLTVCGSA